MSRPLTRPSVSILIDTYNHAAFIARAIDSVLAQIDFDFFAPQIVVVDDGSTDATSSIVAGYGDRLEHWRKANAGQGSAFNEGIRRCRGELVLFLDGDDWWAAEKLRTVVEWFVTHPSCVAVGHAFVQVDEVAGVSTRIGPAQDTIIEYRTAEGLKNYLTYACCLGTSRLAVRRPVLEHLLDVPVDLLFEADEYLFSLLPAFGDVAVLAAPLTSYRIHGANLFHASPLDADAESRSARRLRQRSQIYDCLSETVPRKLRQFGQRREVVEAIDEAIRVEATRLRLMTRGGSRLKNLRNEMLAKRVVSRTGQVSIAGRAVSFASCLLLSPRQFFKVRDWYGRMRAGPRAG